MSLELEELNIKVEQFCRCCGMNAELSDMKNSNLEIGLDTQLEIGDTYLEFVGEIINVSDCPEFWKICEPCALKLTNAYNFRKLCQQTDVILINNSNKLKLDNLEIVCRFCLATSDLHEMQYSNPFISRYLSYPAGSCQNVCDICDVKISSILDFYDVCLLTNAGLIDQNIPLAQQDNVRMDDLLLLEQEENNAYAMAEYRCLQCLQVFKRKSSLTNHVKVHLNNPSPADDGLHSYKCTLQNCRYSSNILKNYKRHLRSLHKTKYDDVLHGIKSTKDNALLIKQSVADKPNLKKEPLLRKNIKLEQTVLNQDNLTGQHKTAKHSYQCRLCDKKFLTKNGLWAHSFHHRPGIYAFNCNKCFITSNGMTGFKIHLKMKHNISYNSQTHAYNAEPFEKVWKFIEKEHKLAESSLYCTTCDKHFVKIESLLAHEKTHLQRYECAHCVPITTFGSRRSLVQHMSSHRTVSGDGCFKCKICNKFFQGRSILKRHLVVHETELKFQCDLCLAKFKGRRYIYDHIIKTHVNKRTHQCQVCRKWFRQNHDLKYHMDNVHNTSEKSFECLECQQMYKTKKSLAKHIKIHSREHNGYKCAECPKNFLSAEGLKGHIKVFHLMQRLQCELCPMKFLRKSTLLRHRFEHRGFDPFICPVPVCCYTSRRKENFSLHLSRAHSLVYNENVHGFDEKTIAETKRRFAEKIAMKKKNESEAITFNCDLCDSKYVHKRNLAIHMKTHFPANF